MSYIKAFLNLSETVTVDSKRENDEDLESFIISINPQLRRVQEFLTRFARRLNIMILPNRFIRYLYPYLLLIYDPSFISQDI